MSYTGQGLFTQATSALTNTFTALAGENSGSISLSQLKTALSNSSSSSSSVNASFVSYLSSNFSNIDQNGDGNISSDDINKYMSDLSTQGMTYEQIATLCSSNGSNSLANTVLTYFDEIDKNGDGKVTSAEITAFSMEAERDRLEDDYGNFKPSSMSVFYSADSSEDDWKSVTSKADRASLTSS